MIPNGKSYSEVVRVGGFQLAISLFGDPEQEFECCINATISNALAADPENKGSIESIGLRVVSLKTVEFMENHIRSWARTHQNNKFHRFDVDEVKAKLIELFKKAGYSFK